MITTCPEPLFRFGEPHHIKNVDDLYACRPSELEEQANILLYGHPHIIEEAMDRQIFSRYLYLPRNLSEPLIYTVPKQRRWQLACKDCGRLRCDGSGQRCSFCWRLQARLKYFEKREGLAYWISQMEGGWENGSKVGITMPVTEWWDDRDIPARPKRLALVDWDTRQ